MAKRPRRARKVDERVTSMSVTILVCPCGRRLRAAGVVPGKSGRCPGCGRTLRMPGGATAPPPGAMSDDDVGEMLRQGPEVAPAEPATAPAVEEDEWNWQGTYDLGPAEPLRPTFRPLDRAPAGGPHGPWPDGPEIPDEPAPEPPADTAEAADGEWTWQGTYDLGEY